MRRRPKMAKEWYMRERQNPSDISSMYHLDSKWFTLEIHFGGKFIMRGERKVYVGGKVQYFDYCHALKMKLSEIDVMIGKKLKLKGFMSYYFRVPEKELTDGLVQIKNEEQVDEMKSYGVEYKRLELYLVAMTEEEAREMLQHEVEEEYEKMNPIPKCTVTIEVIEDEHEGERNAAGKKNKRRAGRKKQLLLEWKDCTLNNEGVRGDVGETSECPGRGKNAAPVIDEEDVFAGLEDVCDMNTPGEVDPTIGREDRTEGETGANDGVLGGEEDEGCSESDFEQSEYESSDEDRNFTCRTWQLSGIPCSHAIAVMRERGDETEEYVDGYYTKDTFLKVYGFLVEPIARPSTWRRSPTEVTPPILRKLPGRPKKCRKKDPNEEKEKKEQEAAEVARSKRLAKMGIKRVSKKGVKMHCTFKGCGSATHNRRTCPIRLQEEAARSQDNATAAAPQNEEQPSSNADPARTTPASSEVQIETATQTPTLRRSKRLSSPPPAQKRQRPSS